MLQFPHMEITSKYLPGPGTLVSETWKLFTSTWTTSIKTAGLFLIVGLLQLTGLVLWRYYGSWSSFAILSFVAVLFAVWISIRLMLTMLKLEAGQNPLPMGEESKKALSLFLPSIWIAFLTLLIVIGGTILFIIPGIYLSVVLTYGQMILIDKGIRGTSAISASRQLIRGRWWDTFFNLSIGGFAFAMLTWLIMGVGVIIIGIIFGFKRMLTDDMTITLAMQVLQSLVVTALLPLMVGLQVKLYRFLQKTR